MHPNLPGKAQCRGPEFEGVIWIIEAEDRIRGRDEPIHPGGNCLVGSQHYYIGIAWILDGGNSKIGETPSIPTYEMFGDTCSDRGVWTPNPQRATPSNSCEPGDRPGHHAAAHIGGSRLEKPGDQEDCEHRTADDDSNNDHRQILAQRFRHVLTLVVGHESTECSGLGCAPGAKAPDIENLGWVGQWLRAHDSLNEL